MRVTPKNIYFINNVHGKWGEGGGLERKEKWGGYAPLLIINVLASYLQLVKGMGLFLIKSRLLCSTQEDLITFYVGVLDCLILTMLPPNQLFWAPPSIQLICNSHSKPWWWSTRLMTIHQEVVMRGVLKTCRWCTSRIRPNSCPLFWHLGGNGMSRCLRRRMVDFLIYSNKIISVPEATLTLI